VEPVWVRQIVINTGEDGSVFIGKILEKDQYSYGFDAQNGEYVNLVTKGIIDPTKIVPAALQNAASISGLLIRGQNCGCAGEVSPARSSEYGSYRRRCGPNLVSDGS
jgi:hypothetical protein